MARASAAATGTEVEVAKVASAMLSRGNAVDAVVAAIFAAAALDPSVLLGPVQLLIGGAGAGLRAVDGRARQPGRGVTRPRGFQADEAIAPASRIAVPVLPAALTSLLAASGNITLAQAMAPALDVAKGAGAPKRRAILERIAKRGARAISDEAIATELLAAGGRLAGGVLTSDDLDNARPEIAAAHVEYVGERTLVTVPWNRSRTRTLGDREGRATRIVAAVDGRGLVAIGAYASYEDGVAIEELELVAPPLAAPVMRGERRIGPGVSLEASAPIALSEAAGFIDVLLGVAKDAAGESRLADLVTRIAGGEAANELHGSGRIACIVRSRTHATIMG